MLTNLRRWLKWLVQLDDATAQTPGEFDAYGSWHGDHWHNLLCSPMDARHYVMEDWNLQPDEQPQRKPSR